MYFMHSDPAGICRHPVFMV